MNQLTFSQMKGVGVASIVSVGLHGAMALAVLQVPTGWLMTRAAAEPVSFEIVNVAPQERPTPVEEAVDERVEPEPAPLDPEPLDPEPEAFDPELPLEPVAAAIVPRIDPEQTDGAGGGTGIPSSVQAPSVDVEPGSAAPVNPNSRAMRVLLNPANVARGGFTVTGPGPSGPSGPAGLGTGRRGRSEAEIERDLASGLRRQAMAKAHITREPVVPRRQADGSYVWQGPMFSARIAPDGEVTFEDGDDISTNGFSASGTFDLQSAIMGAAGQDPRAAERRRFMRETEELRDRLEAQHRREVREREARRMVGRLNRVWATTSRSAEARRRRIFRLWDDTAEDGSMDEVRAAVLRFVRETIPEGSDDAYSAAELQSLNAGRQSRERFAPY